MRRHSNCLRYRELSSEIRLDGAIALSCQVDPAQLAGLEFDTQWMSARGAALVTSLREGRWGYEYLRLVTARGQLFRSAPLDEPLAKHQLLIDPSRLRAPPIAPLANERGPFPASLLDKRGVYPVAPPPLHDSPASSDHYVGAMGKVAIKACDAGLTADTFHFLRPTAVWYRYP